MRIEGETLIAKSIEPYYTQERHGDKPNTVRVVESNEAARILKWIQTARTDRYIQIELAGEVWSFRRTISFIEALDIPDVKLPVNHLLMMICWRP